MLLTHWSLPSSLPPLQCTDGIKNGLESDVDW